MSGQAARDEYVARLKEPLAPIPSPDLAPPTEDGEANKTDSESATGNAMAEKQRKRSINMSGQAARDEYVARLRGILAPISPSNLPPCEEKSEADKALDKTD